MLLISLSAFASGDSFTFPPVFGTIGEYISDLSFTVGQTITLEWKSSSIQDLTFWLVQDVGGSQCTFQSSAQCAKIATSPNNGSMPWTVSRMGINNGKIYYITAFNISSPTNGAVEPHFNTHYFNLSDASSSSSSTINSQSSSTVVGSLVTSTSSTAIATKTSKNNLALGIGAGVGIPLGLAATAMILWVLLQYQGKNRFATEKSPVTRQRVLELDGKRVLELDGERVLELDGNPIVYSTAEKNGSLPER